jgi:WD40 repeat protein
MHNHHPIWSPDGKQLLYAQQTQLFAVSVQTQSGFTFGNPVALPVKGFEQIVEWPRQFDIMPDGKQFVVVLPFGQADTAEASQQKPQIQVVLNWFEELKQRVPVR